MFKELAEKLRGLIRETLPFDPSVLEDDVAMRTDWTPAKGGGTNFRTHRLVTAGPDRAEFRATRGALAFYLIFLVVGLGVIVGAAIAGLSGGRFSNPTAALPYLIPLALGVVFTGVGGGLIYFGAAPIVFDRRRGDYWKGRVAPSEAGRRVLKDHARLERIHALQIISEHCRSDDSSYYSYELNLVLDDGTRLNVVDHGNQTQLREDAGALGKFLDRPVWDATALSEEEER